MGTAETKLLTPIQVAEHLHVSRKTIYRHIEAGHRPDEEPFIEPRDTRKMEKEPTSR